MATTTNYGWETPDDTDLVKDGALAQRTTASAIDTSLFGITNGKNVGLVPLATTTVSGASTVTFTGAFSATYDNYKIVWNGFNSSSSQLKLVFGSTTSGYYSAQMDIRSNGGNPTLQLAQTNAAFSYMGSNWSQANVVETIISNPFNSLTTTYFSNFTSTESGLAAIGYVGGHLQNTTSYTACTITPAAGTFTGTFRLYGIRNS